MATVVISTDPYLALFASSETPNLVGAPINFTATYEGVGNVILLSWQDNPINDNPATSYTITRAGQPDVIITAPTTTYDDTRDIIEAEGTTIIWFVTLTNIDGTSNARQTSFAIPAETYDFNVELQTTLVPIRALGSPVATYTRTLSASQYDYKGAVNEVLTGVTRFMGARLDPDGSTYYKTRDDGTTPIDGSDFFADAKGPFGFMSEKASTNLLQYSTDLTNLAYWSWAGNATVEKNGDIDPSGGIDANLMIDDASGGSAFVQINKVGLNLSPGTTTFSVFYKPDQLNMSRLQANGYDISGNQYYELIGEGSLLTNSSMDGGAISRIGDGWYDASTWFTTTADLNGAYRVAQVQTDGSTSVDLDGTSSVFAWGTQAEAGDYRTTFIKTEAATVSREPEHLSYTTAGNLQANDVEITLEYIPYVLTDGVLFETFVDVSNSFQISINSGILEARKQVGGITHVAQIASPGFAVQVASEIVFTQTSTGGMSITVDGGAPGTFADNQNLPLGTDMFIGPKSGDPLHAQCSIRLFKTRNLA